MNRIFLIGLFILSFNLTKSISQTIDLSSVDEFFKVTSTLKTGQKISEDQWKSFEHSSGYMKFAERTDKTLINTIKSSINIAFGYDKVAEKDSILNISKEEVNKNITLLMKKLILINYLDINNNYELIKSFRNNYDFNALIDKAKQRLSSFLGSSIDSTTEFKPVYFLFINADGKDGEEALYIDLNLVFKQTEEQRINFLAHEFFHNYRRQFENHDFNYKSDLNFCIDMIQNEGIADMIDKTEGYEKYYSDIIDLPDMTETMVNLYNQAQDDLERFHNLIMKNYRGEISENEMIDRILEIVKFNGHPIGFYMANQIITAGFKSEMLNTFYKPYEFYCLYNLAAKKQNLFQLSNEFMVYLKGLTK